MNIGEATPRRDDDGKPQQTNQQQHRGQKRERDREHSYDRERRDDREYKDRDRDRDREGYRRDKGGDQRAKGNIPNQQMPQGTLYAGQAGMQAPQLPLLLNPNLQALALNPLLLQAMALQGLPTAGTAPASTDHSSYQQTWQPMGPGSTTGNPSASYSQPTPPATTSATAYTALLQQLQTQQLQALQQLQAQQSAQSQANQNSGIASQPQFSNLLQQLQALQKK